MKTVAKVAASLGLIVLAVLGTVVAFPPCSGWRDCYRSMKFSRPDLQKRNILSSFTASKNAVAFSAYVKSTSKLDTVGLLYFDRLNGHFSLIHEPETIMVSPHFSDDGGQILFVRRKATTDIHELISCETASWHCHAVLKTAATIFSPFYIDSDTVLYASSPVYKDKNGRTLLGTRYDFYLLKVGSRPKRLTEFNTGELSSVSLAASKLIFEATGISIRPTIIPYQSPVSQIRSEIFSLNFDIDKRRIATPTRQLRPIYAIDGFSISPSASPDGKYVAFLNARGGGTYHFNLVIADAQERILRYVKTSGVGFSRPAFADGKVIANELTGGRYRVREFDVNGPGEKTLFEIGASENTIDSLDRITLKFVE